MNARKLFEKDKNKWWKLFRYIDDFSWLVGYETALREVIKAFKRRNKK